jgi:hypothetical protein
MATVHGHAWLVDPVSTIRARADESSELPIVALVPRAASSDSSVAGASDVPAQETIELLARIESLLGGAPLGRPLSELRALLSEPTEVIQRALVVGIRMKRLRRVGAHNKLRYVVNG